MTALLKKACVIGDPIAHSLSPVIHGFWISQYGIDAAYERAHVAVREFQGFISALRANGHVGANVTVPHKETAYRLVDRLDETAKGIGAVNTLWFDGDVLVGANSDVAGFLGNLDEGSPGWDEGVQVATVIGAGGAARAVIKALDNRNVPEIRITNRTEGRARQLLADLRIDAEIIRWEKIQDTVERADLIVNTTTLGMAGHTALELDLSAAVSTALVTDIVYTPLKTPLLEAAERTGLRTVDGLGMLLHQAVLGFTHWFGLTPQVTPALRTAVLTALREKAV